MKKRKRLNRMTPAEKVFEVANYFFMILVVVVMLYPFLNVLAIALNDSTDTVRGGIYIWGMHK